MNYRIEVAKSFETELKKLSKAEQKMVYKKVQILAENPFYPSLRTKKIQGIENIFECSVNMVCKTFTPSPNLGGVSRKRILKGLDYKTFGDSFFTEDF